MKDLTLQQAKSFGSFHNLRLFLDDYLLYLVEESIAHVNYTFMDQRQQNLHGLSGPSVTSLAFDSEKRKEND